MVFLLRAVILAIHAELHRGSVDWFPAMFAVEIDGETFGTRFLEFGLHGSTLPLSGLVLHLEVGVCNHLGSFVREENLEEPEITRGLCTPMFVEHDAEE